MAYKVIILYQLYMPSYFLGTFTEYPYLFQAPASLFTYLTIIHLKSQNRLNRMWLVCLFISCPNH